MALFEGYERRIDTINKYLAEYGFASIEDNKVMYLYNGVECVIYGDNLTVAGYIDIANGIEVVGVK